MSAAASAPAAAAAAGPTSSVLSTQMLQVPDAVRATRPKAPFVLAPNDWILPQATRVALLFFYELPAKYSSNPEQFMSSSRMAQAFERLLAHYPIIAGRFIRNDQNGTIEIDEHASAAAGVGVPFVSARTDASIKDLDLSQDSYVSTRSLPPSLKLVADMDWGNPLAGPIFALQHTRFACGGVALGVHMHHIIGDAASFFGLVSDWAELYRSGGSDLSVAPSIDRSPFRPSAEEIAQRLKDHKEIAYKLPEPSSSSGPPKAPGGMLPKPTIMRSFRIEGKELANLKKAATTAGSAAGGWVSTFEAITAHLHRLVYIARHPEIAAPAQAAAASGAAPELPALHMAMATNWRGRLHSPAPHPRFFGNGALYSMMLLSPSDAREFARNSGSEGFAANAARVHQALAANDDGQLRGTMAWIAAQPRRGLIVPNFNLANDFAITQWSKFTSYIPFDLEAPPCKVCLPFMSGLGMDGVAILMACPPAASGAASASAAGAEAPIELLLGLEEETMKRFEANPEFRQYRN